MRDHIGETDKNTKLSFPFHILFPNRNRKIHTYRSRSRHLPNHATPNSGQISIGKGCYLMSYNLLPKLRDRRSVGIFFVRDKQSVGKLK